MGYNYWRNVKTYSGEGDQMALPIWNLNGLYVISAICLLGALVAVAFRKSVGKLPGEVLLAVALGLGFLAAVKNAAIDLFRVPDAVIVIVVIVAGLLLIRAMVHSFKGLNFPISAS